MDISLLSEAIPSLPKVLLPIIVDYGKQPPHAWRNDESATHPLAICGNHLTCQDADPTRRWPWYFIVSDQTVVDGPDRWKLSWTLGCPGWIYVGITTGNGGTTSITGSDWLAAATADNLLVGLTVFPDDRTSKVVVLHNDEADFRSAGCYRTVLRPDEAYSASFEANYDEQTLRIVFENEDLMLPMPETIRRQNKIWRPCIVAAGIFTASILAY
jgi:hypothetical protein